MIIRAIVFADNGEEAIEEAEIIFERFVEEGVFDYYTPFNDGTSKVSGVARWGEKTAFLLAKSKEGKREISQAMKATKKYFFENIKELRNLLKNYSDDEIFEDNNGWTDFRYRCYHLGRSIGSDVFLYNYEGDGILNKKQLKEILSRKPEQKKVYVVPADVHY